MIKYVIPILLCLACAQTRAADVELREVPLKDEQRLRQLLPDLFNGKADLALLDEALRLLVGTGAFENVFIQSRPDGNYTLIAKPLRVVESIQFKGNNQISTNELRDYVDFKTGDRFDRKRAVAAGERMKNHYGERGFFNAIIEVNFNKLENKNIEIVFSIVENPPCRITELNFATSNAELKARLDYKFRRLLKKPLTTERLRRLMADINEFLITNRYLNTEVVGPQAKYNEAKTEAKIQLELREPYRWEFFFEGYNFETRAGIYRAIDLKNKERKNVDPAGESAERLRRHYLSRGFPNVTIESRVASSESSFLKRVFFKINEGPRVKIKNIEVQGRISRNSSYYQDFILKNSSDLVADGYYNRLDLENGFKNLTTELRNQGFLRAKVLSSRIDYNDKRDKVTVYLLVEEGPQTQIRALDFEGNRFFSSFELAQVTDLQTNTPLRLNSFETGIEKLKAFYRNQGFLEMKLLNESDDIIQYNDKGTQARILFRLFEGPRIRISAIAVEGNSFTKSRVLLKEADFRIGDVLTPQKLEDATARLNKMGLFSRVDIRTLEEGTSVSERTLIISVVERDPGVFRFGGGVNNERDLTIRGFTGLSYNNLWGTGRGLSGRLEVKSNVAEIGYPEHEITAGYLEPFLFGTRTRGRLNLTRSERVFEYERENELTKITTSNRVDLLAERDLTRFTKLTWKTWSLESRREWERQGRCIDEATYNPLRGKCPPNIQQIATLGPIIDIDYRDNPFLPTRGSFTRFVIDYSNPSFGSSTGIEFVRGEANYTFYKQFGSPRTVWANSVRAGYVANLSQEPGSGVPTSYAFLLGGISTVRGFDSASDAERIPKDGTGRSALDPDGFNVERGNQRLIKTDSNYYLFKSELRFTLYEDYGGVIFYDGAAVRVSGYDFGRPYRDAVGFGLRYNTPVGPAAADFAFKINPEPDERVFRFHLSIGTF